MTDNATLRLSRKLKGIAKGLDKKIQHAAGERIAFTLIVFTKGRASYVSTCDRKDSIEQMETLLEYWHEGIPDIKAHDVQ